MFGLVKMEDLASLDEISTTPIVQFRGSQVDAEITPVRRPQPLERSHRGSASNGLLCSPCGSGDSNVSDPAKDITCGGCSRIEQKSVCFYDPNNLVDWTAGRVVWCNDCFSVHRTMHSKSISLTIFPDWLADPGNFELWNLELAAYVRLKTEQITPITAILILQLVERFKTMAAFVGVPTRRMAVMLLNDIKASSGSGPAPVVSASTLVLVIAPGRTSQAATFVSLPRGGSSEVELPRLDDRPVHARMFPVGSEGDVELVQSFLGAGETALVVRNPTTSIVPFGGPADMTSKLDGSLWARVNVAKTQVAVFSNKAWENIAMESTFTNPLAKATALHSEAEGCGNTGVKDQIYIIVQVLQASKSFLKLYRELARAKNKVSRHIAFAGHLKTIRSYCKGIGYTMAPSFDLLVAKTEFLSMSSTYDREAGVLPRMADVIGGVVDGDLVAILAEYASDDRSGPRAFSPSLWLCNLVKSGLEVMLGNLGDDWHGDAYSLLAKDLRLLAVALEKMACEIDEHECDACPDATSVPVICSDSGALATLFESMQTDMHVKPSKVKNAHDHLRSNHMGRNL